MRDAFFDQVGPTPDVRSWLYADAYLRALRPPRLPPPTAPFWYREPGLWLPLSCAITYDGNLAYLGSASVNSTVSFTVGSNPNRLLLVGIAQAASGDAISAMTYAGTSLTEFAFASHGVTAALWSLVAPATGTNTLALTTVSGTTYYIFAASYAGVSQTGFPDGSVVDTTGTASPGAPAPYVWNLTTATDNAWLAGIGAGPSWYLVTDSGFDGNATASAKDGSSGFSAFYHRGPVTPAGATTLSTDTAFSGGANVAGVIVAFAPAAAGFIAKQRRTFGQRVGSRSQ